ncbi:arginine N-succinyltransferase [Candidatus Marinamargulisbacteria bacterium SCGC AAA071-K20]|nr:arginine N-succinyltransferase [Candidatus Marinamargulisbacteria bacterium SCGC AAA071-K20]
MKNIVFRPACLSDLDQIYDMAMEAEVGMTSLPKDKATMFKKIEQSVRSFEKTVTKPSDESYFFVLENTKSKRLLGICNILASVGVDEPFFSYQVQYIPKESRLMGIKKNIPVLKLTITRNGPSEIGGLYLRKKYRKKGVGRFLSMSRFLYMSSFPHRFKKTVIAEMRGVSSHKTGAPFWNYLGKTFFELSFSEADLYSAKSKGFIHELMPRYPIYVDLLPQKIKEVIAKTHKQTTPALHLLNNEGFKFAGAVDIFDAGPKIAACTKDLRIVKESTLASLNSYTVKSESKSLLLVANQSEFDFRVACTKFLSGKKTCQLSQEVASLIHCEIGESICFTPLSSKNKINNKNSFMESFNQWYHQKASILITSG